MARHTPDGVDHVACLAIVAELAKVPTLGPIANVAKYRVEDGRYEEALEYLLGVHDALTFLECEFGTPRIVAIKVARQGLKAAIPARR